MNSSELIKIISAAQDKADCFKSEGYTATPRSESMVHDVVILDELVDECIEALENPDKYIEANLTGMLLEMSEKISSIRQHIGLPPSFFTKPFEV